MVGSVMPGPEAEVPRLLQANARINRRQRAKRNRFFMMWRESRRIGEVVGFRVMHVPRADRLSGYSAWRWACLGPRAVDTWPRLIEIG